MRQLIIKTEKQIERKQARCARARAHANTNLSSNPRKAFRGIHARTHAHRHNLVRILEPLPVSDRRRHVPTSPHRQRRSRRRHFRTEPGQMPGSSAFEAELLIGAIDAAVADLAAFVAPLLVRTLARRVAQLAAIVARPRWTVGGSVARVSATPAQHKLIDFRHNAGIFRLLL